MKVSQHPQKPLGGSNQIWAMTSGKKDMYSDLRGHSMCIATRRARLEAREAGFLVFNIVLPQYYCPLKEMNFRLTIQNKVQLWSLIKITLFQSLTKVMQEAFKNCKFPIFKKSFLYVRNRQMCWILLQIIFINM